MDIGAAVITSPQSSELMEPAQGAFDHPVTFAQTTTVRGVAMGDGRGDPTGPQLQAMMVRVIGPIRVEQGRASAGPAGVMLPSASLLEGYWRFGRWWAVDRGAQGG